MATMDEENARPKIVFEADFPSGDIRPVGRGVVFDLVNDPLGRRDVYLDDWFEEEVYKAVGLWEPHLTGIRIRVEIESATRGSGDNAPTALILGRKDY